MITSVAHEVVRSMCMFYTNVSRVQKTAYNHQTHEVCACITGYMYHAARIVFSINFVRLNASCLHNSTFRYIPQSYQQVIKESQTLWCRLHIYESHIRYCTYYTCIPPAYNRINRSPNLDFSVRAYAFNIRCTKQGYLAVLPYAHLHQYMDYVLV